MIAEQLKVTELFWNLFCDPACFLIDSKKGSHLIILRVTKHMFSHSPFEQCNY